MCNESILSSTNTGMDSLTMKFFSDNDVPENKIKKNFSGNFVVDNMSLFGPDFEFPLNNIDYVGYLKINGLKSFKNFPKHVRTLIVTRSDINSFSGIGEVENLIIDSSDVNTIKGLPKPLNFLSLGNNRKMNFTAREVKRHTGLKPEQFSLVGRYDSNAVAWNNILKNCVVLGEFDVHNIDEVLYEYGNMLMKKCPYVISVNTSSIEKFDRVNIKIDYLANDKVPNGIAQNGIYLLFSWHMNTGVIELTQEGHLELTDEDRAGKYKFYALKGFVEPYKDQGGKWFRKTRMYDFTVKSLDDAITDWVLKVTDAAVKDQGGKLERLRR